MFIIHFNEIGGTIPSEYGNLRNMKVSFSLMSNAITGTIPSELGMLEVARYINLYYNSLTGTVPGELCNLNISEGGKLILAVDDNVDCPCCS